MAKSELGANNAARIAQLDRIIKRSLRQLAIDTHVGRWCAKENDWVNYFAHKYLMKKCSERGPLKNEGQICIEVSVPQPLPRKKYPRPSVRRDLVIWSKSGETAFDGSCFAKRWSPCKHPIAILEWTVHRPGHKKSGAIFEKERQWLLDYCKENQEVLGYAILIDGTCLPRTLQCNRFFGGAEDKWPTLQLAADAAYATRKKHSSIIIR